MHACLLVTSKFCVDHLCMQNLDTGTTAVVGMVTNSHLYMGWTGDSQIILVRRGVPVFVSQPHKPEQEVATVVVCKHVRQHASTHRPSWLVGY